MFLMVMDLLDVGHTGNFRFFRKKSVFDFILIINVLCFKTSTFLPLSFRLLFFSCVCLNQDLQDFKIRKMLLRRIFRSWVLFVLLSCPEICSRPERDPVLSLHLIQEVLSLVL